jgi:hypothetical protein
MGHRANYLILSQGGSELFYSHWAANTVDRDFFWGPGPAEAHIRSQEPTTEWLDDVWCEGGAALDWRQRDLVLFGGQDTKYDIFRRRIWMSLMRFQWPGWTVRWATREIVDLAALAGLPPAAVLGRGESAIRAVQLRPSTGQEPWGDTLVSVLPGERHLTLQNTGEEVLSLGPDLLDRLDGLRWECHFDDTPPGCGMQIDPQNRRLRYWLASGYPELETQVASTWAGWTVSRQDDWAFEHLASHPGFPQCLEFSGNPPKRCSSLNTLRPVALTRGRPRRVSRRNVPAG